MEGSPKKPGHRLSFLISQLPPFSTMSTESREMVPGSKTDGVKRDRTHEKVTIVVSYLRIFRRQVF
jgi:hypothetical protein